MADLRVLELLSLCGGAPESQGSEWLNDRGGSSGESCLNPVRCRTELISAPTARLGLGTFGSIAGGPSAAAAPARVRASSSPQAMAICMGANRSDHEM